MANPKSLFCPNWLYEVSVGITVFDYITKDFSIEMIAKKFSDGLSEQYIDIPFEEISKPAEACIRFMAEIKGAEFEAHERANNFIHYRLKFNGLKGPRKLKSLLGSAFDGTKEKKYNEDTMIKDFKAYCFSLRSGTVPKAPSGWSIKNESDLGFYADIIGKDFSLDDLL